MATAAATAQWPGSGRSASIGNAFQENCLALRNSTTGYGLVARWLHWLTALCMLPTVAIAVFLDTRNEDTPGDPALYFAWMPWRKTGGLRVLVPVLLLIRLPWMLANAKPELAARMSRWQKRAAVLAHWTLYGLILVLPLPGWLGTSAGRTSFKLFDRWPMPCLMDKDQALSDLIYEWCTYPWAGSHLAWSACISAPVSGMPCICAMGS